VFARDQVSGTRRGYNRGRRLRNADFGLRIEEGREEPEITDSGLQISKFRCQISNLELGISNPQIEIRKFIFEIRNFKSGIWNL
jgi:hypothetical protein